MLGIFLNSQAKLHGAGAGEVEAVDADIGDLATVDIGTVGADHEELQETRPVIPFANRREETR